MTIPMPDKADDGLHIHCTELRGTMSAWSEVKLPCSKCDWGHVPVTPPDITDEMVEAAATAIRDEIAPGHDVNSMDRLAAKSALTAALKTMGKGT